MIDFKFLLSALLSLSFALRSRSHPLLDAFDPLDNSTGPFRHITRSLPAGLALTVLPVGDSITLGFTASEPNLAKDNGYRLDLINLLKLDNHAVNFIGTQSNGGDTNSDPYHEGYGYNTINMIMDHIRGDQIIARQPNLILIHAGTNDMEVEINGATREDAPNKLGKMIDYFLSHDPEAVVLVAMLIENKNAQAYTDTFNSAIPAIVGDRYMKGYKVRVVDMRSVRDDLLSDALHPTPAGYSLMADVWHQAILDVPTDWWSTLSATGNFTKIINDVNIALSLCGMIDVATLQQLP